MTTPAGASVWRRYEIDGFPASGPHPPVKSEVIAWANSLEGEVAAATTTANNASTAAAAATAAASSGLVVAPVPKTSVVTITIATPGVLTWGSAHGLATAAPVSLSTTGALPTGLVAGTTYFAIIASTTQLRLATTAANAIAGTAITTSGTQSGTHTALANFIPPGYSGHIREVELAAGSATAIVNQVAKAIVFDDLPPGNYDITASGIPTTGGGAWATEYHFSLSTIAPPTVVGLPNGGGGAGDHQIWATNQGSVFNAGPKRFVCTTVPTTRVYFSIYSTFGTNGSNGLGTMTAFGYMRSELK